MNKKSIYYDLIMGVLALVVVIMLAIEMTIDLQGNSVKVISIIDTIIWFIFCFDYFIRLFISKDKKNFILENKVDLISIIPFNSMFKALRVLKITRLFKLTKLAKLTKLVKLAVFFSKFKARINKFMKTNNFNYVVYLTLVTVILGAIAISLAEKMNFGDALWWSFVTATTVGYGDISPASTLGRITAATLMIVGIGFIGMLTGTIATFFLSNNEECKSYKDDVISDVKTKLDDFDNLTREDIKNIYKVLDSLKIE